MRYLFFAAIAAFCFTVYPQRLLKVTAQVNGKEAFVPYTEKNDVLYLSGISLAKLISGNYFFNEETSKLEVKFSGSSVVFTSNSKFAVSKSKNGNSAKTYQMPIQPFRIDNDIFIPAEFCFKYFNMLPGIKCNYKNKNIIITSSEQSIPVPEINIAPEKVPIEKHVEPEITPSEKNLFVINSVEIEEKMNGTFIRLKSNKKITKFSSSVQDNILYLFMNDASVDPKISEKLIPAGCIKSVNVKEVSLNYQIEFTIDNTYSSHEVFQDPSGNDLLISIHNKIFTPAYNPDGNKEKWKFDVVVIDPGHGGKDAGAIGVAGTKEKEINLKLALKLGDLIKKNMPDVKVIYTRNTDSFVELYKRGKIANENNGKLFISIHCNSLKKKPSNVSGYETFLLRPGKTQDAIEIAEFENSVISMEDNPERYKMLDDENFILVSMAHSSYMRHSEEFSDILNKEMSDIPGLPSRGIKQAGFYVLVGASMPGILFEAGFLSNKNDEKLLKSNNGQNKIADRMFKSVQKYKDYYDRLILEGK